MLLSCRRCSSTFSMSAQKQCARNEVMLRAIGAQQLVCVLALAATAALCSSRSSISCVARRGVGGNGFELWNGGRLLRAVEARGDGSGGRGGPSQPGGMEGWRGRAVGLSC